jgi:hypothetical protein
MAAICDAALRGIALKGHTLFCTTFPCHMCARLIIAAGIERVVYMEPYPKSKTQDLYEDSVNVDSTDLNADKVSFQSFVGISPNRYINLFTMGRRKDSMGRAIDWERGNATPQILRFVPSYIALEEKVVTYARTKIDEVGLQMH